MRLQGDFGRLATTYHVLETMRFGRRLQECRTAGLSWIKAPRHALLLGEGDGRFLEVLLRRFPETRVHVLDASQAMLAQARRRVARQCSADLDRIRFQLGRFPDTSLDPGCYDLLVTNFFLDCFDRPSLERLLPDLDGCLTEQGLWLHTDFRQPERGWRRARARFWLAVMYRFFALTTNLQARSLQDPHPMMRTLGWDCCRSIKTDHEFLQSSLWQRKGHSNPRVDS